MSHGVFNFEQTDVSRLHILLPEGCGLRAVRMARQVSGCAMSCQGCGSGNQEAFTAEINIHFRGLKNLDKPGVLVVPKLLVCLDCGFSRFTTPETALAQLASGTRTSEASSQGRRAGDATLRRPDCS